MKIARRGVAVTVLLTCIALGFFRINENRIETQHYRWKYCISSEVNQQLTQNEHLANDVVSIAALSACKSLRGLECAWPTVCSFDFTKSALRIVEVRRELLVEERDDLKKRALIEKEILILERAGVGREDLKTYFREEILNDNAQEKNEEAEAAAAQDYHERPGRF